ncbi:MAG: hypothetical protein WAV28_11610, partial [Sedimentisphaerales bacterium]
LDIIILLHPAPLSTLRGWVHPVQSLPQGIRRKASLSGLRTTGGVQKVKLTISMFLTTHQNPDLSVLF